MSLYNELKRRNVFKVTIAYIIVGWLIMQIGEVMAPALRLPDWINSALAFFVILGFPLAIIFAWAFEMTPEGLKLQKEVDEEKSITHITGRKLDFWIIGLLAAALVFFAYDRFVLDPGRDAAKIEAAVQQAREEVAEEQAAPEQATEKSIAVLPFVNMSNDPDQEFFSDGISEELLNVLARYPGLRVAARTSSFQFKGQNQDVADIARQLRVNHVLEGSVRKAGDRIRITAQLIEAENGYHLWSETFDRELDDVFAIQDEISAAIGDALKVTLALDGAGPAAPTVAPAANPQAFEEYATGRALVNLRGKENIERAVKHLQKALELDPAYAPAHAQLAIAYILLARAPGTYGDWPLSEAEALAVPHLERAMALDAGLAESYGIQALLAIQKLEYDEAILQAKAALALNPSYSDAMNWMYIAYQNTGQHKESNDTMMGLLKIDPLSVAGRSNASELLAATGRVAEGREMARSLAEQYPALSLAQLGSISLEAEGEVTDGLGWFIKALAVDPDYFMAQSYIAYLLAMLDLVPETERIPEDPRQWAWYAHQDYPQAVAYFRKKLEYEPGHKTYQFRLARVLYLSSAGEEAQTVLEQLLADAGGRPLFSEFYTTMPTAWAAFGRQQKGDLQGAEQLLALVEKDQGELERAGKKNWWYYKTEALVAALRGEDARALQNLELALDAGGYELSIFDDPALGRLSGQPEFIELRQRLQERLLSEREKALRMICIGDPEPVEWEPLPETCEGVEQSSG